MLRIVLPVVAAAGRQGAGAIYIARVDVPSIDIRVVVVAYVIIVDVNVDVTAPPPTVIAPTAVVIGTDGEPDPEGDRNARSIITGRGVVNRRIRVDGRSVNGHGIIGRHINDLWVGLLNDHDGLRFYYLSFHRLLFGGFQVSCIHGLLAHALHRVHHITLLRKEGVTQVSGPLDTVDELLHQVWERGHGLDAGIPVLVLHGVGERLSFQVRVFPQPILELNEFERIGGRREHLGQERV